MDAVKFFEERKRMCTAMKGNCSNCPPYKIAGGACIVWCFEHPREAVPIIEQWAAENPRKTRQNEFLKQHPNVMLDKVGIIDISPCRMDQKQYPRNRCRLLSCAECRHEFWMQEVE